MTRVAHVICVILIFGVGHARIYDRCELALELRYRHEIVSDAEVATWVCIVQHQSSFNTAAVGRQADGRGYHGLLQISDEFWCSPFGQGKACGMSCSRFVDDDITDDLHCSRIIHEEHQRLSGDGFNAWTVYKSHCSGGRALPYIHGCFDNYISQDKEFRTSLPTVTRPAYTPSEVFRPRKIKTRAKIFERCELAQELVYRHHVPIEEVAMWVCIAQHESNFNTSAVGHLNADGSGDHGLFQISDIYWCSPPGKGWVCGLSCAQLEDDDISDDVKCMRKIYAEHQRLSGDGFNAWAVYGPHCRGRAEKYIDGCFMEDDKNLVVPLPGITAPVLPPSVTHASPTVRARGKIYDRCELAHELLYNHLLPRHQIATWVCIAQHESSFNTAAVGRLNGDGSADHGLFQISDLYWCSPPGNGLGCGISCDRFEDEDITDDVECIRRIHKEHTRISGDGFTAWTVYNRNCLGNVERYIEGCFTEEVSTTATTTTTTSKTEKFVHPTKVFSFSFGERISTTKAPRKMITTESPEPPTTSRRFSFSFGDRTTEKPIKVIPSQSTEPTEPSTTSKIFTFSFPVRTSTTESPRKMITTKKKSQTFNIFDFYLNYFKATQKTTKQPKTTTLASTEAPTEATRSTTRSPSVYDLYLRRTTASPKSFFTTFANSLPTVKPYDLDYIKGLTTPKNIISRAVHHSATHVPQAVPFDSIFNTFLHA